MAACGSPQVAHRPSGPLQPTCWGDWTGSEITLISLQLTNEKCNIRTVQVKTELPSLIAMAVLLFHIIITCNYISSGTAAHPPIMSRVIVLQEGVHGFNTYVRVEDRSVINSFPPNDTKWCHHGHGLSISEWEFIWGI